PLREQRSATAGPERVDRLIEPWLGDLGRYPLYISLDKDVLTARDAVVNWDSGHLTLPEVQAVLSVFLHAARRRLAGMDLVGDWSPVQLRGVLRRVLHWTEHPRLKVLPLMAAWENQRTNLILLDWLLETLGAAGKVGQPGKVA